MNKYRMLAFYISRKTNAKAVNLKRRVLIPSSSCRIYTRGGEKDKDSLFLRDASITV